MSAICSPFASQLNTSNISSILMSFTDWNAVDGVDICFSLMLIIKANVVEEETK